MEIKEGAEDIPDNSINLLVNLVEHAGGLKFSNYVFANALKIKIWNRGYHMYLLAQLIKDNELVKEITEIESYELKGLDFALKTIAASLVKAARYDAFVAKYQAMKERVQAGKEEILQVEQFFKAIDDSHLLGN